MVAISMRKRFSPVITTLLIAFALLMSNTVIGAHLMGGDLTYKYIGNNKYALKFLIYRDDNCTSCLQLPAVIQFYIYPGENVAKSDYSVYTTSNANLFLKQYVKPDAPNCASPTGVKAQEGVYLDTVTMGNDTLGYHITWFSPGFRNGAIIANLNQGNCGAGKGQPFSMLWYTFIPANKYKNSSPQFISVPLPYLCVGQTNTILPTASDPDKDSLVFSLEVPYSPPPCLSASPTPYPLGHPDFQQVTYLPGFSVTDPFGAGKTSISIDPATGVITANPTKSAAYVIAIQVKEYRYDPVRKKSVYLDFVRRDLEFIVGTGCPSGSPPTFFGGPSSSSLVVAPGDSLVFDIGGYTNTGTDSVHISATGGIFQGANATISSPYATFKANPILDGPGKVYGHFVWKPSCQQITYSSPYTVTFNLSDQSCHTIYKTFQITVKPRPILTPPLLKCADIISNSSIKLSFSDSSSKPEFLQYKIYRDTNYSGNYVLVDSLNSFTKTSWTDTKATKNDRIVYSYYITAQNNCGLEGLPSDTVSSIVLTVKKIGDKRVNITWNAASKHIKSKYKIYRGSKTSLFPVDSTLPNKRSYTLASCSGSYYFQVQVTDSTGSCVAHSGDTTGVILNDNTPPNLGHLEYSTVSATNNIQLFFIGSDSNDTRYYKIYRVTNTGGYIPIDSVKHVKGQKIYSFTDNHSLNLSQNTYCYKIYAIDTCGNISPASNQFCQSYVHGTAGQLSNSIKWSYSFLGHRRWLLQRNTGSGWDSVPTKPWIPAYTDTNVVCNKSYQYRFFETDLNTGDTSISNVLTLTPFDTIKPPQPKIYVVTVSKNHSVFLNWTKSVSKVKKYIIYRKEYLQTKYKVIDTVSNDTFFTDYTARPDSTYYTYEVQAMDSCAHNLSALSAPHTTIWLNVTAPGCRQALFVQWTDYIGWTSGVNKYEIYRSTDLGLKKLLATVSGTTDTFTDLTAKGRHIFRYSIKAYQNSGTLVSWSDSGSNTPFKPYTPYIRYASKISTSATTGTVVIRWKSMKTEPYLFFSRLYYKKHGAASFVLLKDSILPNVDSFVHKNLNTNSEDHEYYMVSYDTCGNISDTSLIHKTMDLQISVGQLVHNLAWTPYKGWRVKEYYMQMLVGGSYKTVDSVPGTDTAKIRFPAPCNSAIYYRILAESYLGDIAISDTSGAKAIDSIPSNPPKFIYATVYGNSNNLIAFRGSDSSDTYGYYILRSDSGGAFNTVGFYPFFKPEDTIPLLDPVNTAASRHCYVIVTVDSCLNATLSDTFCPVFLTGKPLNQANEIEFAPFKGFKIKEYHLETWVNNQWQLLKIKTKPRDTSYIDIPLACYVPRYYRVVAYEDGGDNFITYSDSIMLTPFDTIVPDKPLMHYATAIPGTGYHLGWHWDRTSDVKYFEIWRGDSTGKQTYLATVTYDSTYTDNILPVNNRYKYYVIAIDSCDPSHRSPASVIQNTMKLYINNNACKARVLLRWSAYSGFESGTKSYNVYRTGSGGIKTLVASVGPGVTSYTDSNVVNGNTYVYQVQALDSAGNYSSWSDTISGVPFVYPVPKPVQIRRATVVKSAVNGAVLIEWNNLDFSDPYATGYRLYGASSASGPFALLRDESDKTVTSWVQSNINTLSNSFYYYIAPYNICNKEGIPSGIHHTVNLQIANTNLNAMLTWNQYSGFAVDHYEIYKAMGNAALVPVYATAPSDTVFNDTSISCKKQYTYQVYAIEKGGNLLTSVSDSLTITAFDNTAPGTAKIRSASVTISDAKLGQILINFNTISDKNRRGYVIYRSQNGGAYTAVDTFLYTGKGVYQYFDNSLNTKANTYSYFFTSVDSCGNLALPSDTHTVVHLVTTPLNNMNKIAWNAYQGFSALNYNIFRKTGSGAWIKIATVSSATTEFLDSAVFCHVLYTYRILAQNTATGTDSAYSNTDTARAFKTTPPLAPQIIDATVTVTSNTLGQIQLNWNASPTADIAKYLVYRRNAGAPWQLITTLTGYTLTYTDENLNTHYWPYYYKVFAVDSCGNLSIDSGEYHRTVNLTATPADEIINLKWNTYWGFKVNRYDLYKNGKFFMSFDSTITQFPDSFVLCPLHYNYVIKAIGKDTASWSNRDSAAPIDTTPPAPPTMKMVTVSIPNSTVDIVWEPSISGDMMGYRIYRRIGSGANEMIYQNNASDSIYSDTLKLDGAPVCYEIVAYDHCGNTSIPSDIGCVINLNGAVKKLEHDLSWNPYKNWKPGVAYYNIYRREGTGGWALISTVTAPDLQYVDKDLASYVQDFCYRVEAVENHGGLEAQSWSTVVCLNQPPIVWIPNSFTPEYSFNLNDNFGPRGTWFKKYDMKIFNRWGEMIYETHDGKPWNGSYNGAPAVDGVYLYEIDVHGFDTNTYTFKGTVLILK
jgi:fibronectin type 3 domain-containing protein